MHLRLASITGRRPAVAIEAFLPSCHSLQYTENRHGIGHQG
jgi:hypothetical protein